jgi:hypothetical protein
MTQANTGNPLNQPLRAGPARQAQEASGAGPAAAQAAGGGTTLTAEAALPPMVSFDELLSGIEVEAYESPDNTKALERDIIRLQTHIGGDPLASAVMLELEQAQGGVAKWSDEAVRALVTKVATTVARARAIRNAPPNISARFGAESANGKDSIRAMSGADVALYRGIVRATKLANK